MTLARIRSLLVATCAGILLAFLMTLLIRAIAPPIIGQLWSMPAALVALGLLRLLPDSWIEGLDPEGGIGAFVVLHGATIPVLWGFAIAALIGRRR